MSGETPTDLRLEALHPFGGGLEENAHRTLKILIFTHQYLPRIGGVQVLVQNLLHFLGEETDHEVVLVAPHYESTPPPPERRGRLTIHRLFNPERKLSVLKALFRFPQLLREERPDLVHGQETLIDGLFCRFACPRLDIPYLLSTQGELNPFKRPSIPWSTRIKVPYLRWVFGPCRGVVTPEPTIQMKLKEHVGFEDRYSCIPNAIYITHEQASETPDDHGRLQALGLTPKHFFLFLGRLIKEKGVHEVIQAVAAQKDAMRKNGFHFFFSGTGKAEDELRQQSISMGVDDLVLFSDDILPGDKWILLRHCRSMVLPSWEENLPISILEAFGLQTPIIGSDIPEIDALILTSAVGKTFRKKEPSDLARCLAEDMATSANQAPDDFQKAMASYDLRQMGQRILDLYEKTQVTP